MYKTTWFWASNGCLAGPGSRPRGEDCPPVEVYEPSRIPKWTCFSPKWVECRQRLNPCSDMAALVAWFYNRAYFMHVIQTMQPCPVLGSQNGSIWGVQFSVRKVKSGVLGRPGVVLLTVSILVSVSFCLFDSSFCGCWPSQNITPE